MVIRDSGGLQVLMAIAFYPRGGSAQVVRYLARALTARGHNVLIVAGSLKGADPLARRNRRRLQKDTDNSCVWQLGLAAGPSSAAQVAMLR